MHSLKETLCKTLDDIFCDICGGSCKKMIDDEAFSLESATLSANWGYGYGIGLDLVTYYDKVFRLDFSINKRMCEIINIVRARYCKQQKK